MDHDWPVTAHDVEPTGRRNAHLRKTVGDMVRSMAVVLAIVFLMVLLAWRPEPDPITVVDIAPAVSLAGSQAAFPVSAPTGLPPGWRPTSARWEPTAESTSLPVLHLGYVTPAEAYAQVSQSTAATTAYVVEQTSAGVPSGTQEVAGTVWERFDGDPRRSLMRTDGGVVTIVSGTADWDELVALAASLRPVATTG